VQAILDTCTVSELEKPRRNPGLEAKCREIGEANLFLSVITCGAIGSGVARMAEGHGKNDLTVWAGDLERQFSDRRLGIDLDTARVWGELGRGGLRRGGCWRCRTG